MYSPSELITFCHLINNFSSLRTTVQKIKDFGWELMPHPPYSPDLAPSDFHLFSVLQQHLNGQNFQQVEDLQEGIRSFFASKPGKFYRDGIEKLLIRWQNVINSDGEYIVD